MMFRKNKAICCEIKTNHACRLSYYWMLYQEVHMKGCVTLSRFVFEKCLMFHVPGTCVYNSFCFFLMWYINFKKICLLTWPTATNNFQFFFKSFLLVKIFVTSLCCLPYILEGYGSNTKKSVIEFCLFFPVSICDLGILIFWE